MLVLPFWVVGGQGAAVGSCGVREGWGRELKHARFIGQDSICQGWH